MDFRFMFLRDEKGAPVGCVAITLEKDYAFFQVSTLNPADRFDRKLARQLAIGRTVENPMSVKVTKKGNIHDVSRAVMQAISKSALLPTRSVKAAKLWLKTRNG